MSTDTEQMSEHYELQIQKHASIDLCKECYAAYIVDGKLQCINPNTSPINCNILKIHGDF